MYEIDPLHTVCRSTMLTFYVYHRLERTESEEPIIPMHNYIRIRYSINKAYALYPMELTTNTNACS